MPLDLGQIKEQLEAQTQPPQGSDTDKITIDLILERGAEFDPKKFVEWLNGQFGTVSSDQDTFARGSYQFRLTSKEREPLAPTGKVA